MAAIRAGITGGPSADLGFSGGSKGAPLSQCDHNAVSRLMGWKMTGYAGIPGRVGAVAIKAAEEEEDEDEDDGLEEIVRSTVLSVIAAASAAVVFVAVAVPSGLEALSWSSPPSLTAFPFASALPPVVAPQCVCSQCSAARNASAVKAIGRRLPPSNVRSSSSE